MAPAETGLYTLGAGRSDLLTRILAPDGWGPLLDCQLTPSPAVPHELGAGAGLLPLRAALSLRG